MMINDPSSKSNFSKPRAKVLFNKKEVVWSTLELSNTNYYNADTFVLEMPMYGNVKDWDVNRFTTEVAIDVEISISIDGGKTFNPAFYGIVDNIDFKYATNSIRASGRDYSSKLIDTKTTERYPNSTSSQVAIKFAKEHGLTPVVTDTSTPIGVFLNNEYVDTGIQKTEWDILTFLARKENFLLYLRKNELHFQPKPKQGDDYYSVVFKIGNAENNGAINSLSVNAIDIDFARCLTIAKDVSVQIISFNSGSGATIKRKATKKGRNSNSQNMQNYVYNKPNLTSEQALQLAQSYLQQISERELVLNCSLFFDNVLDIVHPLQISGTKTKLDQIYYVSKIDRTISFNGECEMIVEAKNHSVESETSIE